MLDYRTALQNVDKILGLEPQKPEQGLQAQKQQEEERKKQQEKSR